MLSLPSSVEIVEVAPRDGLQSFRAIQSTDTKLRIVERLIAAGLRTIEVTGFVHPSKIPQLADAEELCERLPRGGGVTYRGMAPNVRGAERAVAAGIDEVVGLITASRTYLAKNQNMTESQAIKQAVGAFHVAEAAGKEFVMAIGLSFWCAYEGLIPEDRVLRLIGTFRDAGIRRFYLAATVGLEDPVQVSRLFGRVYDSHPDVTLGFHVHNLGGRASALTLAALDAGAQWVEAAICGIGGGIAMPETMAATGNYATEDLVALLDDSGVDTGLSQDALVAASRDVAALLSISPHSYAGNGAWRQGIART